MPALSSTRSIRECFVSGWRGDVARLSVFVPAWVMPCLPAVAGWTLTALQIIDSANSVRKQTPQPPLYAVLPNSHPIPKHPAGHDRRIWHENLLDADAIIACARNMNGPRGTAHTIIKRISVNNNCDCLVVRAQRVMAQLPGGLRDTSPPAPLSRRRPLGCVASDDDDASWHEMAFSFVLWRLNGSTVLRMWHE